MTDKHSIISLVPKVDLDEDKTTMNGERTKLQNCLSSLLVFFIQNYLPISLISAVAFGIAIPAPGVYFNHKGTVYFCVSILIFYSGLYLKTSAMKDAFKMYKAYIWGTVSILGITCTVAGQLTKLLNFDKYSVASVSQNSSNIITTDSENSLGPFEFKIGLILYSSMPCTVGTGVIMVLYLKGNVALAILLTAVTNIIGIFTIPLYVSWLIISDANIQFNIGDMMLKLFLILFIPLVAGKCLRINRSIREFVTIPRIELFLKLFALTCLAFILLIKVSQSSQDGGIKRMTLVSVLVIVSWTIAMHVLFLLINTIAAFLLRLPPDQKKCIILLASQKTLSQAVAATVYLPSTLGDHGLIAVSMVFCHITALLFDSVLIPVWLYIEEWQNKKYDQKDCDKELVTENNNE